MKILLAAALCVLAFAGTVAAESSQRVAPEEFGQVIINNYSKTAGLPAVVFDHWLHRSMFTCRLCHVDIGFAMEANGTNITAKTNMQGYFCGTCHNGKRKHGDTAIFASCSDHFTLDEGKLCDRCHSLGNNARRKYNFFEYTKNLPQKGLKGLGDGIDWEGAEEGGVIKPIDSIEGVSMTRPKFKAQGDFSIQSHGWMSDVIFSHKKHAVWNGCEVCHPDIFPSVHKGDVKYTMFDIYEGQYCGVCHGKVAFSLYDCQRCHTKPVQ